MPNNKNGKGPLAVPAMEPHLPVGAQAHGQGDAGVNAAAIRRPRPGEAFSKCCLPSGCERYDSEPIMHTDPGDAIKVFCNNEACTEGKWMHGACFILWEQHVLNYLRSCGRARSWSEKQRLQNLWTKKGYDLAFKACDCKCSRGHLRKDLDYVSPPKHQETKKKNKKKPQGERPSMSLAVKNLPYHPPVANAPSVPKEMPSLPHPIGSGRPQLRIRTASFSSTGSQGSQGSQSSQGSSSPPTSDGTPPLTPGGSKKKFDFFTNHEQAAAGNIFHRRRDYSVFNVLPRYYQNPYHIKMEDEGPHGNDETRCFVLTNLSTHQVTSVGCVVCQCQLTIYDKYPLIDGTFFLSPLKYNTDLQVLFDSRMMYLNAICMRCLGGPGGRALRCRACKTSWDTYGRTLIIGTMYSYDIFAGMPCCAQRLTCKNCRRAILAPNESIPFSEYCKQIRCPYCSVEDYHFIKNLVDIFSLVRPPHFRP